MQVYSSWQHHHNKNEKGKVGRTCKSVSVARNMKQNNAESQKRWERTEEAKKGECLREKTAREPFSLATGDQLGKKRPAHRD